jgi:hypothetical protein
LHKIKQSENEFGPRAAYRIVREHRFLAGQGHGDGVVLAAKAMKPAGSNRTHGRGQGFSVKIRFYFILPSSPSRASSFCEESRKKFE